VMRFIRLPWSPKTPTHFFPIPVTGHIAAQRANFDKLRMTKVSTDFARDAANWRVYNFKADSMEGRVRLDIAGRAANNWINIKGRLIDINAASLFLLSGARNHSPIEGRLYATANLWADTDTDFFSTLAGTTAIYVRDGRLNKFTLLTHILSLIDLKNWITAKVPNLSQTGIPFKSITANFKGNKGDFYTDNLKLEGPVMDITAQGDIAFASGTMNMRIALIPFNTINWLVNKIPIIGKNLASGSSGLLAAYFQVSGPASDPHVRPKPITSVAEFVAKTLSLPVNIIKPHTIKP
ncbi:MAG: AsmA-like C-terminal region-containing protein, partial [Candidatus Binataceae bacterium]